MHYFFVLAYFSVYVCDLEATKLLKGSITSMALLTYMLYSITVLFILIEFIQNSLKPLREKSLKIKKLEVLNDFTFHFVGPICS